MMTVDRQCTATSKQSGLRCKRLAIRGGTVCSMHGGKTPAVAAAAEQRLAEGQADQLLAKLWPGLVDATPVTDPVLSLQRLAGSLEAMADVLGGKVNDLTTLEAGDNLSQLRGHVVLLERVIGHLRGLLVDMARLGLEDRVTRVLEDQGAQVAEVVEAIAAGLFAGLMRVLGDYDAALVVLEREWAPLVGAVASRELMARHEQEVTAS